MLITKEHGADLALTINIKVHTDYQVLCFQATFQTVFIWKVPQSFTTIFGPYLLFQMWATLDSQPN